MSICHTNRTRRTRELNVVYSANSENNFCYGDSNGTLVWGGISGGCPIDIPECLDEGNLITDNFGGCSSALSFFENQGGCNYEFANGDFYYEVCPQTCDNCPDYSQYVDGYNVTISNSDTGQEFSPYSNSLLLETIIY